MREAKVLATPGMVAGIIFDNSGSVIYADGLAQILDDITGKYVLILSWVHTDNDFIRDLVFPMTHICVSCLVLEIV